MKLSLSFNPSLRGRETAGMTRLVFLLFLHAVGEDGVVFVGEFDPLGLGVMAAADKADNRLENADKVNDNQKRQ